jgi:hypothetical protein
MSLVVNRLLCFTPMLLFHLVLHPEYVSGTDLKLTSKAEEVRKLLIEKIPVSLSVRNLIAIFILKPIMLR